MSNDLSNDIAILGFYSFINIKSPEILLPQILLISKRKYIKGNIILAKEGFNGTISGSKDNVKLVLEHIIKITSATNTNIKINYNLNHPFPKLKVKIKHQIVAISKGEHALTEQRGEYIEPKNWDNFVSQPDVVVVDTRNDYEIEVGSFKGAVNPYTKNFKQFPEWAKQNTDMFKNKKIAMFCTGGIRCEKSTALMKMLGHDKVYHLRGGVLQYLEDTKNVNKLWQGRCFVFDERFAVDDMLNAY